MLPDLAALITLQGLDTAAETARRRLAELPGIPIALFRPVSAQAAVHDVSRALVMCRRFWQGRIPLVFGGGNCFVDARDVAAGMLRAAERGRPGERYILGGANRSYTAFDSELARVADRPIPRFRLPTILARLGAAVGDRVRRKKSKRPLLSSAQARLLGLFFYYDCSKAGRELGYTTRPLRQTLADAHRFWTAGRDRRGRAAGAS